MSSWTVTIVGGTIAAVLAGVVLFYLIPSLQAPPVGVSNRASSPTLECPEGYEPGYGLAPDGYLKKVPDRCLPKTPR